MPDPCALSKHRIPATGLTCDDRYNKGPTREQIGGTCNAGNFDTRSQQVGRYEVPNGTVLGVHPRGLASEVLRAVRLDREVVLRGGLLFLWLQAPMKKRTEWYPRLLTLLIKSV